MKLGEALELRGRLSNKLGDLNGRIRMNALTQEGTDPAEDANALLVEFEKVSKEFAELIERITRTNQQTTADYEGETLTLSALLHRREHLRRVRNMVDSAATAATPTRDRYRFTQSELKYEPRVAVSELRLRVDELDEVTRWINAILQEVNWKTELV